MVKVLRSLIQEKFSEDIRFQIELISRRRDIVNQEKHEEIIKLLRDNDVGEIVLLGPGTNRYAFKIDGFVVKVATDHDGKIDNWKEFKMAKRLYPYVAKTHEVSENGTLLVAEYIPPFESYMAMARYGDRIKAILKELSAVYLIGDVGLTSKNFSNWGIRNGTNDPVCLDFAYVYEVSSELFVCRKCKTGSMLLPNDTFTELYCSNQSCGKRYQFEDIRARIGNDVHRHEIGDLSLEGYRLIGSGVETELTIERSNYLEKKFKKIQKKVKTPTEEIILEEDKSMSDRNIVETMSTKVPFASPRRLPITITAPTEGQKFDKSKPQIEIMPAPEPAKPAFTATMGGIEILPAEPVVEVTAPVEEPVAEEPQAEEAVITAAPEVVAAESSVPSFAPVDLPASDEYDESFDGPGEPEVSAEEKGSDAAVTTYPNLDTLPAHYYQTVSNFSNMIGHWMEKLDLYTVMKCEIQDKEMTAKGFYKGCQNAVFRSLMQFLNFQESIMTTEGGETRKVFEAPDVIPANTVDSTRFLQRFWNDRQLNEIPDGMEFMSIYASHYGNCYGIQEAWTDKLRERLALKMPITERGVRRITNVICMHWCAGQIYEDPKVTVVRMLASNIRDHLRDKYKDVTVDALNDCDITVCKCPNYADSGHRARLIVDIDLFTYTGYIDNDLVRNYHFENIDEVISFLKTIPIGEDLLKPVYDKWLESQAEPVDPEPPQTGTAAFFADIPSDVGNDNDDEPDGEDDDEEVYGEDDDEEEVGLHIDFYPGEKYDVIRLFTTDLDGEIIIPFYVKVDEVDLTREQSPSMVDDRNGLWDWLTVLVPDMVFWTKDPSIYLEHNENPIDENMRCVILDENHGEYAMGIYHIGGINCMRLGEDGYEAEPIVDMDTIRRIFRVIREDTMFTRISHLRRSLSLDDLIYTEDEIREFINSKHSDDDPDDEDIEEEPVTATPVSELEAAALEALTGDTAPKPEVTSAPAAEVPQNRPGTIPVVSKDSKPKQSAPGMIPVVHNSSWKGNG